MTTVIAKNNRGEVIWKGVLFFIEKKENVIVYYFELNDEDFIEIARNTDEAFTLEAINPLDNITYFNN